MSIIGKLLKEYKTATLVIGISDFAVCIGVFQILQTWCDYGISNAILRWVFPSLAATFLFLLVISIYANFMVEKRNQKNSDDLLPPEAFANSVLLYAEHLKTENRDYALVDFRNKLTHTLHLLGNYQYRVKLGYMAYASATVIDDQDSIIEILIDDLGWCNHLLDKDEEALSNINEGIEKANKILLNHPNNQRTSLAKAKGLRHLSILLAEKDYASSEKNLSEAQNLLEKLDKNSIQVQNDIAQIYHAKASIVLVNLGIGNGVKIRKEDKEAVKRIKDALLFIDKAETEFKRIGEIDRYVKSLFLHYSFLESIGDERECARLKAIIDRALGSSQWVTEKGMQGIIK